MGTGAGRAPTALTYPGGQQQTLSYNADGELSSVGYPSLAAAQFTYNPNGTLASAVLPNGVSIRYGYDANDWLKTLTVQAAGSGPTFSWTYGHDGDGHITAVSYTGSGSSGFGNPADTSSSYSYNADGELVGARYSNGTTQSWTYNALGEQTSQTTNGTTVDYSYNAALELTAAGSNTYSDNADGERTGATIGGSSVSYTYDATGELTGYSGPSGSVSFTYNGAGERVAETAGGVSTAYVLDEAVPTAPILAEVSGSSTTTLLYAGQAPLGSESPAGSWSYPIVDGMGNVRYLTDAAGTATVSSYLYDGYGNVLASSGTVASPLQYKGEPTDGTSGLVPMGVRMYDPSTGVLLTPDPLTVGLPPVGALLQPLRLNPYAFADNEAHPGGGSDGAVLHCQPAGLWLDSGDGRRRRADPRLAVQRVVRARGRPTAPRCPAQRRGADRGALWRGRGAGRRRAGVGVDRLRGLDQHVHQLHPGRGQ